MFIKTKDHKAIVNTDLVSDIETVDHGGGASDIVACTCNGRLVVLGRYPSEKAEIILNNLFDVIADACTFYEMPVVKS